MYFNLHPQSYVRLSLALPLSNNIEFGLANVSSVVKHIAIDAGGYGIDSWAGQIEHSVANSSPPLRYFCGAV